MTGGNQLLDQITMTLRSGAGQELAVYIDVFDNSLSRRWIEALNTLLAWQYHLEKNYCWVGWTESDRTLDYLCEQVNCSIAAINDSGIDYKIHCDSYTAANCVDDNLGVNHARMNQLHRYFEDLQGWSGGISQHYRRADSGTRWHIRQLNLLCHEIESLVLSQRKLVQAPEWRRPSQLMCWLNAPRFQLEPEDYELFGIETINRSMGGVYVGVNKAVGKHHWEVFCDEGRDSRVDELTTTGMRTQTEAAGDFDIEWARDPGAYPWQQKKLAEFKQWLQNNNFDPQDSTLTIGHPKVAQVNLQRSFGTEDYLSIWQRLAQHLDVYKIQTSAAEATYSYRWSDPDYQTKQIGVLK
jgi:hypothetical protein